MPSQARELDTETAEWPSNIGLGPSRPLSRATLPLRRAAQAARWAGSGFYAA